MIDFARLSHWYFWSNIYPRPISDRFALFFAIVFGLMVIGAYLCRRRYRELKKRDRFVSYFWRRLSTMFWSLGLLGLFLTFFAYEGAPLLGARFWFLGYGLLALTWLGRIFYYRYHRLPNILSANADAALKKIEHRSA